MKIKNFRPVLLLLCAVFLLTACSPDITLYLQVPPIDSNYIVQKYDSVDAPAASEVTPAGTHSDSVSQTDAPAPAESSAASERQQTEEETAAPMAEVDWNGDVSTWSMQQIIDCYKAGMKKTDDTYECRTDQKMQLVGKLPGKASALSGPVNLAMKLGSQPFDALTGGYWDLEPDDLVSATAVRDGDYIVISLTPKEQTDGPNGDEHVGHVGHVVNVVQGIDGFLAYVEENFGVLNAQYSEDGVTIHYINAYAKDVRINTKTQEMESGKWGYTIDLLINDASILGISLDNFTATIQYDCWYPVEE